MKAIAASLVGLCLLNGCSHYDDFSFVLSNDSATFTVDEEQAAISAISRWQAGLDGALVIDSVSVGSCSKGNHFRTICLHAVSTEQFQAMGFDTSQEEGYTIGCGADCADTYFPVSDVSSFSYEEQLMLFQHEIGHGLGLKHTQEGTAMFYMISTTDVEISNADKQQYLFAHHLPSDPTAFTLDKEH